MIDLNIQIKLLIFSFIFGFYFSVLLDIFNSKTIKCKKSVKFILAFFIVLLSTIIYLEGIKIIGNAIFHLYSLLTIIVGFFAYDLIANKNKK